jgi:hypothetical protein
MALQVRRGTNAERLGITPLEGELIYVTDTKQLYVGDGTTTGGTTTIANTIDSVVADPTPQLGGNLDLNEYDITGTGNINLGDNVADLISVVGSLNSDVLPSTNITWNLGGPVKKWKEAWISQLNVDSQITAERINASLIADDSTVVFDATTGGLAGTLTGDVVGNVYANDGTTLLVDAVTGVIPPAAIVGDLVVSSLGTDIVNITSPTMVITPSDVANTVTVELQGYNAGPTGFVSNYPQHHLINEASYDVFSNNANWIHGSIKFGKVDADNPVKVIASVITSRESHMEIKVDLPDDSNTFPTTHQIRLMRETGYLGVGVEAPLASIHTPRDALISDVLINNNFITTTTSNSNLELRANGTGTVELGVPTQSTVGAAGGASALPASPDIYFKINVNGTDYVVPGFAVS